MSVDRGGARPRAYYPDGTDNGPTRARTPGWDMGPDRRIDDGRTLARALGWASVGLGIFQVMAPDRVTGFLGIDEDHAGLVRLYGGREIAQGIAILSERTPAAGVWSRVAGDALDLATLGVAMSRAEPRRDRVALAMVMVVGIGVIDAICARQLSDRPGAAAVRRIR